MVRAIVVLCLLSGIGAGVVYLGQRQGWIPDTNRLAEAIRTKPEVRIAAVSLERGRAADALVVATGYVESRRQARIGARATGRIEQVNVEEGTRVKAQDILAVLEHADLDASIVAVKAAVARSRSELQEQEVLIERARRDLERADKSIVTKSISAADFDNARFQYDSAVARKASLQAAIQLAEARVEEAEQLRENMFVRAPFDGTVISKDAELGESIMPGGMGEASGRGSVVTIADLEHLEVDCDVKEDFISRVAEGQMTEVSVDAVPDQRYKGRVRKIIPMGDRARSTVKVRVEILDADERLFPDMSSTVYFLRSETETAAPEDKARIFCPADAVISAESETFVWLLVAGDRTKKCLVVTGESRDGRTEIMSGLKGGEKVIVGPSGEITDDMPVRTVQ
jgi:RND family efflux transporter MFP subunit